MAYFRGYLDLSIKMGHPVLLEIFYARFHALLYTSEFYRNVIHSCSLRTLQIITMMPDNF